jgi:pectinesterase
MSHRTIFAICAHWFRKAKTARNGARSLTIEASDRFARTFVVARYARLPSYFTDGERFTVFGNVMSLRERGGGMTRWVDKVKLQTWSGLAGLLLASPLMAQTPSMSVKLTNPLPIARESETIALPWATVTGTLPNASATRIRVKDAISNQLITSQALDADADGRADSLLFQITFAPREVKRVVIEAAPQDSAPSRVHVKFVPEREDVAWESDRIAFRMYGKKLWELENLHTNGIDVWPKRTRALVLDKWYAKGHDGYHIDTGEGADFYQVGTTLGTGGTGVWRNETLFRGDNFLQHRIIADGPVRAIFEVDYGVIDAAGIKVTERKRVSIDGGQHFFKQESTFSTADRSTNELQIAIGLVKRPGTVMSTSKDRGWAWVTGWGPIEPRTRGHGDLGNAVLMPKTQLVDLREVDNHYLAIGRVQPGATLVNYVGAGWTSSRDVTRVEDWWAMVDGFAQRLSGPIQVVVER